MTFNIKRPIKKAGSVVLMGSLFMVSVFSVKTFARDVYVNVDNSTIHSVTLDDNIDNILGNVGVKVSGDDIVEKFDNPDGSLKVNVKRVFDVSVFDGFKVSTVKVTDGTVGDILSSLGIKVDENDILSHDPGAKVSKGMSVTVIRRDKVVVSVDGEEKEIFVLKNSLVSDVLKHENIELSEEDSVSEDLSSVIYEGMRINVDRVRFEEEVKEEPIPRETVETTSGLLDEGTTEITKEGCDGKREIKVRNKIKGNEVIETEVLEEKVVSEPVKKMIVRGTKKKPVAALNNSPKSSEDKKISSSENNSSCAPKEVKNVFYGSATAYTASSGARTATGAKPVEGVTVAVNPKLIPYGSRIMIESSDGRYKMEGIAQDTGGALRNGSAVADIYMNSKSACKNFGRKSVKISVIK